MKLSLNPLLLLVMIFSTLYAPHPGWSDGKVLLGTDRIELVLLAVFEEDGLDQTEIEQLIDVPKPVN